MSELKPCINDKCFHNDPNKEGDCSLVTKHQLCKVKEFDDTPPKTERGEVDLPPCPCCGSSNLSTEIPRSFDTTLSVRRCLQCGLMLFSGMGQKEADRRWSRRATPTQPEALAPFRKEASAILEHWAEEYECAMMHLDDLGVPRVDKTGKVFSLVGRINRAITPTQSE